MTWRELAWNGVRFSAPALWEVVKIGPRYLLLADQGEPAMEIKWERIKGRFSHRTALKRLKSLRANRVKESPLPKEWEKILDRFIVKGFAWQAETGAATGAILYCPACGHATLIQFFAGSAASIPEICRRVLASFRDHGPGNRLLWSIFDIRAEIPAEYPLVRYRFEAGTFELHFGSKRQQIALYRWGPAAALLAKGGLSPFAAQTTRIPRSVWHPLTWTGHDAVQWEKPVPESVWVRCRERLAGNPHFQWFRLWHLSEKNRILGMGAKGDKTFQTEVLDRICTEYESL